MMETELLDRSILISWIAANDLSVAIEDFRGMPTHLIYELYSDTLTAPGGHDVWFYVNHLASGGRSGGPALDTESYTTLSREVPDPHIDMVRTILVSGFEKSYSHKAFEAAQEELNEAPNKYWGLVWMNLTSAASTVYTLRPENIQVRADRIFKEEFSRLIPAWSQHSLGSYVQLHEEVASKVKEWGSHDK